MLVSILIGFGSFIVGVFVTILVLNKNNKKEEKKEVDIVEQQPNVAGVIDSEEYEHNEETVRIQLSDFKDLLEIDREVIVAEPVDEDDEYY
jgi:PHD/YefM family antitoxin component YafN of YafNO toxin-antitoxin module